MTTRTVTVDNPTGLHARPAANFCKLAGTLDCDVYLEKQGKRINAKSVIGVLVLGINEGSEVDIITDGVNEDKAMDLLVDFIDTLED